MATSTSVQASSQVDAESSVAQQALLQSGEGSEAQTESEMQLLSAEKIESEQTQKTNLEE
jgi:hypothetical protein